MLAAPPRLKRLATAFCCATLTTVAPLANAEDGGERSLAQMASASVTDAATSA